MGIDTREQEGIGIDYCRQIPAQHNSFSHEVCVECSLNHVLFWTFCHHALCKLCAVSAQQYEVTMRLDCTVVVWTTWTSLKLRSKL